MKLTKDKIHFRQESDTINTTTVGRHHQKETTDTVTPSNPLNLCPRNLKARPPPT